jgi:uncharacterized membrane protein YvbJ
MRNEEPSQNDIERFSEEETGYCPHCGEEVWDDVTQCPSCGTWLSDGTSHRNPIENEFRKKMIILIVLLALVSFVLLQVF